ncbi:MAG: DNA topoisomerase, partial [Porphyromonadaceae bacterium]|nr:DNA topoisomerase [Porphyromonadaceae bacterium]
MKVCIAEKPAVAREIASCLGATTKRDGYIEGNGYQVTWTYGHLCTLKEPDDYNPVWKRWALNNLPMIPQRFGIKPIPQDIYIKQLNIIKSLIDQAEEVINCGDAGQEGELIQRWVLQYVGCKCPVKRLWISSLTAEAIKEGFEDLKPSSHYETLYEAGLARAIGDWMLGMNATRLYTLRYGAPKQILSVGRVQTPTLALLVQRRLEIENFVPQPYWELKTTYREVVFNASKGRFESEDEAREAAEKIKDSLFEITSVKGKKGKELPPSLFDLTSLQVECNKKYGLSAEETLKTIQSLYEKKLTTYPRVDTTYLPDDIYPK